MSELDYYAVLQVHPGAEAGGIEVAYKRLALKYPPDRNHDPTAKTVMSQLNAAYETLSNPGRRRAYDQARSPSPVTAPPIRPSALVNMLRVIVPPVRPDFTPL